MSKKKASRRRKKQKLVDQVLREDQREYSVVVIQIDRVRFLAFSSEKRKFSTVITS